MTIKNAKIKSTTLGLEDHGILTFWIQLDYGDAEQGFGGYALDTYDKEQGRRIGHAFGTQAIMRVLETVDVEKWESLSGKYVRVKLDSDNWNSKILAIGHITNDKWFDIGVEAIDIRQHVKDYVQREDTINWARVTHPYVIPKFSQDMPEVSDETLPGFINFIRNLLP